MKKIAISQRVRYLPGDIDMGTGTKENGDFSVGASDAVRRGGGKGRVIPREAGGAVAGDSVGGKKRHGW